jgi:hypothetical protein
MVRCCGEHLIDGNGEFPEKDALAQERVYQEIDVSLRRVADDEGEIKVEICWTRRLVNG